MGSLVFQANSGGQVALIGTNTPSNYALNVPATNGNLVTTGDTGTVTNTMLASSAYATPGTIGSGTPNTGAFTTLSASSTVSGTGFTNLFASPPSIGSSTAGSGAFTTLSASSTVSGTGFSTYLASPPAIGGTAPSSIKVTYGYSPNLTLSDAATVAWDTSLGQVATFTFVSTNRTMGAPTNLQNGAFYALAVIQNGGSNTLTWNSVFKFPSGTAPTLSTAAGAKDYFVFRSDGTNLYQQGASLGVA